MGSKLLRFFLSTFKNKLISSRVNIGDIVKDVNTSPTSLGKSSR